MNYSDAFLDAVEAHAELAELLGEDHPEAELAMNLANALYAKAVDLVLFEQARYPQVSQSTKEDTP
jgi:hypothetical protein